VNVRQLTTTNCLTISSMPKREKSRGKLKSHLEVENYCRDVNRTSQKKAKLCGPKAKKKKLCEKPSSSFFVFFFLPQSSKGKRGERRMKMCEESSIECTRGGGKTGEGMDGNCENKTQWFVSWGRWWKTNTKKKLRFVWEMITAAACVTSLYLEVRRTETAKSLIAQRDRLNVTKLKDKEVELMLLMSHVVAWGGPNTKWLTDTAQEPNVSWKKQTNDAMNKINKNLVTYFLL
jgi:hypothetical protein